MKILLRRLRQGGVLLKVGNEVTVSSKAGVVAFFKNCFKGTGACAGNRNNFAEARPGIFCRAFSQD